MWRQHLSGCVLEQAVMIGCPGTHTHWVHLEKPETLESAALRTCMVMSLSPLRNVLKHWLNECSVKNTHCVRLFTSHCVESSPCGHLVTSLATFPSVCFCTCLCDRLVLVQRLYLDCGVCILLVLCAWKVWFFFFLPQFWSQKTSLEIVIGITPHARIAGIRNHTKLIKPSPVSLFYQNSVCPPDLCIQVS